MEPRVLQQVLQPVTAGIKSGLQFQSKTGDDASFTLANKNTNDMVDDRCISRFIKALS